MADEQRLTDLLAKLRARTNHDGTPKPGYTQNVAMLRAAVAELQPSPEATVGK